MTNKKCQLCEWAKARKPDAMGAAFALGYVLGNAKLPRADTLSIICDRHRVDIDFEMADVDAMLLANILRKL